MAIRNIKKLSRMWLVMVIAGIVVVFVLLNMLEKNKIYKALDKRDRWVFHPFRLSGDVHRQDDVKSHDHISVDMQNELHDYPKCMVIHIAVQCAGADQIRQVVFLLRTLLYHNSDHLILHVMTNDKGRLILHTLLDTWKLYNLEAIFYHMTTKQLTGSDTLVARRCFQLNQILPTNVTKVIVLDHRMRFTSNIRELWTTFALFSDTQMVGVVPKPGLKDPTKKVYIDVLLLDLHKIRRFGKELGFDSFTDLQTWKKFSKAISVNHSLTYVMPCYWMVRLELHFNFTGCIQGAAGKALWWKTDFFTRNGHVESLKEHVLSILASGTDMLHELNSKCSDLLHKTFPSIPINVNMTDPCAEFRRATQVPRRTHLYYVDNEVSAEAVKNNDVTLVTQLSMDRFLTLEHMVSNWDGPLVAVMHVRDEEALSLPHRVNSSKVMEKRKNIVFHVVYKRQIFYPINYLRNVGISFVKTPYTVVIDVDLVPSPNLYPRLLDLLSTSNNSGVAWVIPAFEAFETVSVFPRSRTELLQIIRKKKAIGYGMNRNWTKGHSTTNYTKWMKTTKPYKVKFGGAFEPYVVLPTDNLPKYDERLLERMADKISYGRHLNALHCGFKLLKEFSEELNKTKRAERLKYFNRKH